MWEHQSLFRVSAQLFAEGIFNLLDRNLRPEVFLLGLAAGREPDDPQGIVLEPPSLRYQPDEFGRIKALASSFEADAGPRENVYHLHPQDHDRMEKQHWYELVCRATAQTLDEVVANRQENRSSFCSTPLSLNGYLVTVVVQLAADAYHSYYCLPGKAGQTLPSSLPHAAVLEFLHECTRALREADTADNEQPVLDRDYNEVLRGAGRRLMLRVSPGNTHGLYDACLGVAALRHEGDEGRGTMLVGRRHHAAIIPVLTLETPVPLRDHRSIRKLLELTEGNTGLVSDASHVFGLGFPVLEDHAQYEPLATIHFTNHYGWELRHAGHTLMRVVSNTPRLPQGRVQAENFARVLRQVFPDIDTAGADYLWELALEASGQSHGTMLCISAGAKPEAERLRRQCFRVVPRPMTAPVLRQASSIDGAVLIEPTGVCYAIGVILDGQATEKGDSSRGARYNSAVRYVSSSPYPCLAVVVSEDGWIDLLPSALHA
ncbi:MAG: diadenylate cyclase [Janthinobacterium lividum]